MQTIRTPSTLYTSRGFRFQRCDGRLKAVSSALRNQHLLSNRSKRNCHRSLATAVPRHQARQYATADRQHATPSQESFEIDAPPGRKWHRLAALRATIAAEKTSILTSSTATKSASDIPSSFPSYIDPLNLPASTISKSPQSFSPFLTDKFGRQHTYLRISLTERCNLRCTYCMPPSGIPLSPEPTQLTTPEILTLASVFVRQGITKIRLTGGEPTVRRDFVHLAQELGKLRSAGLQELCITSNGLALRSKLDALVQAGLTGVNLSLDTLSPDTFETLTRRPGFDKVVATMNRILDMNKAGAGIKLKLNVVVMRGVNDAEILDFVELGRDKDLEVRFIEYMPFDGNQWARQKMFSYAEMLERIQAKHPGLEKVIDPSGNETAKTWQVPDFAGKVGFITSMTENFCAGCNRLRITSDGNLKVCLFGNAEVSLRDLLRKSNDGRPIDAAAWRALQLQLGEQEAGQGQEGELLEVIGAAVGRKKARHAGMGVLENMKNRPMILIDDMLLDSRKNIYSSLKRPYNMPSPHLFGVHQASQVRLYSNKGTGSVRASRSGSSHDTTGKATTDTSVSSLPHLTPESEIHVVGISEKSVSHRSATAVASLSFSNSNPLPLVRSASLRKGDVLSVARIAGIMSAKRTSDIVPLCHPGIQLEGVRVWAAVVGPAKGSEDSAVSEDESERLEEKNQGRDAHLAAFLAGPLGEFGGIRIASTVECTGKTGVEMEAVCAVAGAGLSALDMVKGVDKGCTLGDIKAVRKSGGRSGDWRAEGWK